MIFSINYGKENQEFKTEIGKSRPIDINFIIYLYQESNYTYTCIRSPQYCAAHTYIMSVSECNVYA